MTVPMIIAYLWNSILSILLVLVWIKLEIVGERIYQQFEYQKLVNTETTKELTLLCILWNNSYFTLNEHNCVKCIYNYFVVYVKTVYLSFQTNCIKSYSVSHHRNSLLFVASYSNLYLTLTHIRFTTTCCIFKCKISQ